MGYYKVIQIKLPKPPPAKRYRRRKKAKGIDLKKVGIILFLCLLLCKTIFLLLPKSQAVPQPEAASSVQELVLPGADASVKEKRGILLRETIPFY